MKIPGLTLIAVNIVMGLIGLACSAVSALGYAAVQQGPELWVLSNTATLTPTLAPATATLEPTSTPTPQATSTPVVTAAEKKSEVEYYRGIFDVCVHFGHQSDVAPEKIIQTCRELVRRTMKQDWFEAPSENWKWPLPEESVDPDELNG